MQRTLRTLSVLLVLVPTAHAPVDAASQTAVRRGSPRRGVNVNARTVLASDFATHFRRAHVNCLRVQINADAELTEGQRAHIPTWRTWFHAHIDRIERELLPVAIANCMPMIVDMHTPPGGHVCRPPPGKPTCKDPTDPKKTERFPRHRFLNPNDDLPSGQNRFEEAFIEAWTRVAARLGRSRGIYALELCNEPSGPPRRWARVAARAIRAIRGAGADRWVVVAPIGGDLGRLGSMPIFRDRRVIYDVHTYRKASQGANVRALRKLVAWSRRHRRPVQIGEFGSEINRRGSLAHLRNLIGAFEELGLDAYYQAWREDPRWYWGDPKSQRRRTIRGWWRRNAPCRR